MPATAASRQLLRLLQLDPSRIAEVHRRGALLTLTPTLPTDH